jgi:hypothetical protein
MISHLNNSKNIFRPLFCFFLPNFTIFRLPIFSTHGQFFGASFELFGRKFGHMATVYDSSVSLSLSRRQSGRERVLEGKMVVIWQFKKLAPLLHVRII